jgi:DNA ligase 1
MNIKPLLAVNCEQPQDLPYPIMASPKLDGIRCLTMNHVGGVFKCNAVTRSLKPIANQFIRDWMENNLPPGLDGELMVVDDEGKPLPFNEVSSAVMSRDGQPNFQFWVFDYVCQWQVEEVKQCFSARFDSLTQVVLKLDPKRVKTVDHVLIESEDQLDEFETCCLADGYEGVMVRKLDGPYKMGRSTEKEAILLKIKRFEQSEAVVIGYEEEYENTNAKTLERVGKAVRSNHASGMVGKKRLGALICKTPDGLQFKVGSGFTEAHRIGLWQAPERLIGKTITYKHQPSGAKEAPRFPVWLGFRDSSDMSN